jgi:hypothetical protein
MNAACSSETLVYAYKTTQCHNPEDNTVLTVITENLRILIYPPPASLHCTVLAVNRQPLKSAMNDTYSVILETESLTVDIEAQQWK